MDSNIHLSTHYLASAWAGDLTASEVKEILETTADKIIDNNPDPQLGNSFGTYDGNGHSQWFGYGKGNNLVGQSIQGDWTLHVQDLARIDVGQLNRWELEIEGRIDAVVELEETPGVAIPDNVPNGIERTLTTAASGQVKEVRVSVDITSVDITHTFIRDLIVTLISPSVTSVILHNRTGGSADNIITTYTQATTPDLLALRGEDIQDAWKLKVADLEGLDLGKLNRWALRIIRKP